MTTSGGTDLDLPRGVPESISRSVRRSAIWTGVVGALLGAAIGICVAVVCWLPDAGVSGHPLSAIRAGMLSFLAGQHGGMTIDGTPVDFVPLGMVSVVALVAWRAGLALAEVTNLHREMRPGALLGALSLQTACYALACMVLVPLATLGTTTAPLLGVGIAALLLFGCVSAVAMSRSSGLRAWWAPRLTATVVDSARGALGAIVVFVGSGALLVAGSLIMHAGRVMDLSRLVGGGLSGLPILLFGVLSAPNGAVAGAAYLSGPGFAVGTGSHVDAFSTSHGTLPAFPLLGALPTGHGAGPLVIGWIAITIIAAGVVVVRAVARDGAAEAITRAAFAASGAGAGLALLTWLGGGAAGSRRLAVVGASPWQVGLAVAGEVAVVALPVLGCWLLWRRLTPEHGRASSVDDRPALRPVSRPPVTDVSRAATSADEDDAGDHDRAAG